MNKVSFLQFKIVHYITWQWEDYISSNRGSFSVKVSVVTVPVPVSMSMSMVSVMSISYN